MRCVPVMFLGANWPTALLLLEWHVAPGFCVRQEDNNAATRGRARMIQAAGSSVQANPGPANRVEDRLRLLKVAPGGPYVRACERLMEKLVYQEGMACTVDEFLNAGWVATFELDCQLQKAQNVLEMLTSRFQQSASTWKRYMDRVSAQSNGRIAADAAQLVPAFKRLHPCPDTCGKECLGHMYYDTWDGRTLIMTPQPETTGSAYSYKGSVVRVLSSRDEITVDEKRINQGLWYATLLGRLENFTQTEKYYFSSGVHSKLRYHGNDPAIILELDTIGSSGGKSMCVGEQNRNPVDAGNFWHYFSNSSCEGECLLQTDRLRPYWMMGTQPQTTIVSKATLDGHGHPMGTITLDVSMASLGKTYLDTLNFTRTAYALMVDRSGSIIFLTPQAKKYIFAPDMTEKAIFNVDGMRRCTRENPHDCTWEPLQSISILEAAHEKHSGANFSDVLQTMFRGEESNCSREVQKAKIDYPRLGKDGHHLVSFCRLSSVPEWGLIIGTRYKDIQDAASVDVVPSEVRVNYTIKVTKHKSPLAITKQVTIKNTGRVTMPFKVDSSNEHFANVKPQRGKLEPGESQVINVSLSCEYAANLSSPYSSVLHIRGDLLEQRGTCFRKPANVVLVMDVLKEQTWMHQFILSCGVPVLGAAVLVVIAGVFKTSFYFIRKHFKREARQNNRLEDALRSTKDMQFPMVLVSAIDFKRLGRLVSHEEMLRDTTWLYSVDEVQGFCEEKHVVFLSHQWTGWDAPDPTQIQYNAMVMSLKTLQTQEGWEEKDMYVWVDYSSIPQKHPPTQALAINSLTVYSSNVAAFVVVAPEVQHKDLNENCDKESYQRRAWCRAEQLAHLLGVGSKHMYLAEEDVLTSLMSIDGWFKDSIYVFQGDLTCCRRGHPTARCDKELLVTPMLGLWAQLCQKCSREGRLRRSLGVTMDLSEKLIKTKHVHKELGEKLVEVFPRDFDFVFEGGRTERRQLFGDLLDRLQQVLNKEEPTREDP